MKRADNYNVGTLQNTVEIEVKDAQSSVQNLISSLNQLTTALNNSLNTTQTNKLKTGIEGSASEISKTNAKTNLLKKVLNFGAITYGVKKLFDFTKDISNSYIEMIETNNLFEVALGKVEDEYGNIDTVASKYYIKAMKFQDEMNEKLATNKTELKQYQAMYYSMLTAQGINKDKSYLMSESLTKAGYDIASLYNLEVDDAMKKLQSGLAGQVKGLRDIGIDVSESALTKVLNDVGIERSVDQLSYAEKEVARYITIVEQAGKAQGDFAKTFENPANQIRVFKNQLTELKQVAGSFITNTFGNILVYVNAIIMAIKEILKFFATLFGYELDLGGATNLADNIGIDDVATGLDDANKSAKKLKNQLMGFDEINNITLPSSGGSSAGSVASGVDDKLLNALKEWDNKMNSISGKAQEYRDKILEALGFTKDINGNLKWSWKNMNGIVKALTIGAGIIAGIYLIGKIVKLVSWLKTLFSIITTGEGAISTFGLGVQTIGKTFKSIGGSISDFITYFKVLKLEGVTTGSALVQAFGQVWSSIGTGSKLLIGTAGLIASCKLSTDTMNDLSNETIGTGEAFLKLTGSIAGATASGAIIGSVFGPVGVVVGAVAGAFVDLAVANINYKTEADKVIEQAKTTKKEVEEQALAWKNLKTEIQNTMDTQLSEQDYNGLLVDELEKLTEANGKVKTGYEGRVSFILNELSKAYGVELGLSNGQITKNGEIVDSIEDITTSIRKQIEAKKAQIILDANEELYKNAIQEKANAYIAYTKELENEKNVREQINKILERHNVTWNDINDKTYKYRLLCNDLNDGVTFMDLLKSLNNVKDAENQAMETYKDMSTTIINYEELQTAVITGSIEEQTKAIERYTNTIQTESGERQLTLKEEMNMTKIDLDTMKEIYEKNGKEITTEVEEAMNNRLRTVAEKLAETTQTVEDLTDDNKEAWKILSQESTDVYTEYLSKVPEETRKGIEKMTGVFIEKTPELEQTVEDMSTKMLDKLDNDEEMRNVAVDNVKNYLLGLTDNKQKELLKQAGIDNVEKVMQGLKQGNLAEDVGINIIRGLNTGLKNNSWQGRVLATASLFANSILTKFKNTFGIHSPSRKTRQFGIYLLEGLGIGINKEKNNVLNSVEDFSNELLQNINTPLNKASKGILVKAQDTAVDVNSYVNYGAVSGNISAQSNVSVNSNIIQGIAEAVGNAMKNTELNVNIEAKTEEGVIVKKATQGFREYVRQTGELPFPVPV